MILNNIMAVLKPPVKHLVILGQDGYDYNEYFSYLRLRNIIKMLFFRNKNSMAFFM